MAKTKRNFSIDDKLWKQFRIMCLEKGTTATNIIETFVKKEVTKYEKKKKT